MNCKISVRNFFLFAAMLTLGAWLSEQLIRKIIIEKNCSEYKKYTQKFVWKFFCYTVCMHVWTMCMLEEALPESSCVTIQHHLRTPVALQRRIHVATF